MAFEEDVGAALPKACELDSDNDAVHLARAAQIVRRRSQTLHWIPRKMPRRICAITAGEQGPTIKDQTADSTTATLAIAQMKFNSIKHKRTRDTTASVTVRHTAAQETQAEDELWLAFGTGKSFWYMAAHEIATGLDRFVILQYDRTSTCTDIDKI